MEVWSFLVWTVLSGGDGGGARAAGGGRKNATHNLDDGGD